MTISIFKGAREKHLPILNNNILSDKKYCNSTNSNLADLNGSSSAQPGQHLPKKTTCLVDIGKCFVPVVLNKCKTEQENGQNDPIFFQTDFIK